MQPKIPTMYRGKKFEDMTREELIKALTWSALKIDELLLKNINKGDYECGKFSNIRYK